MGKKGILFGLVDFKGIGTLPKQSRQKEATHWATGYSQAETHTHTLPVVIDSLKNQGEIKHMLKNMEAL